MCTSFSAGTSGLELEVRRLGLGFEVCLLVARLFHVPLYLLTYPVIRTFFYFILPGSGMSFSTISRGSLGVAVVVAVYIAD